MLWCSGKAVDTLYNEIHFFLTTSHQRCNDTHHSKEQKRQTHTKREDERKRRTYELIIYMNTGTRQKPLIMRCVAFLLSYNIDLWPRAQHNQPTVKQNTPIFPHINVKNICSNSIRFFQSLTLKFTEKFEKENRKNQRVCVKKKRKWRITYGKMCSRQELRQLLHELLFRLDQVAYLGARTQFNEECNSISNAQRYGADKNGPHANGNVHFERILRFQRAYIRYFVFVLDPYTEFIVPMKSSSLSLFINNILSRDGPTQSPIMTGHTSRTIIEFLQVNSCHFMLF